MTANPAFPLTTERLVLRLHVDTDSDWLLRIYSQPEVARYLLDEPWDLAVTRGKLAQRLQRTDLDGPGGALGVVIEHRGEPIGDLSLWLTDRERRVAEIGWVLDPDHSGHGFAREAVRALLDLAFDRYHLHRVAAQMDGRNTASAALAAAVGMQQEAYLRQSWWSKGEWTDTAVFAVLAADRP